MSEYLFEIFIHVRLKFNSHTIWIHVSLERNHCHCEEFFLLRKCWYIRDLLATHALINVHFILLSLEKNRLLGIEHRNRSNKCGQLRNAAHNLVSLFWHKNIIRLYFTLKSSSWWLWLNPHTILLIVRGGLFRNWNWLLRFHLVLGLSKEMSLLIFSWWGASSAVFISWVSLGMILGRGVTSLNWMTQ